MILRRMRGYSLALVPVLLALIVWGVWLVLRPFPATVRVGSTLAVSGGIVLFGLWKVPQWQVSFLTGILPEARFTLENEARKTLAQAVGGIVLLTGFYATWQNLTLTQKSLAVSQEGQITDRFTKAVEQLGAVDQEGHKKLEVRLGGIYALERIAEESPRDSWPIMEVLSSYVRENSPSSPISERPVSCPSANAREIPTPPVTMDIQAILTVIGRRNINYDPPDGHINLATTYLGGANLKGAHLENANLFGADLSSANMSGVYLNDADLYSSILTASYLSKAHLERANLTHACFKVGYALALNDAHLEGAKFIGADLTGADFTGAHLERADFYLAHFVNTNFSGAIGLTQEQIEMAYGDLLTKLPSGLTRPSGWR